MSTFIHQQKELSLASTGGAKVQATGHRPQIRSQKTIGHWTKLFWTDVLLYKNKISQGTWGVVLPLTSYTEKLHPKGVLLSGFRYMKVCIRVGILLVEVFKRVGKSVIWVCEMAQRAAQTL